MKKILFFCSLFFLSLGISFNLIQAEGQTKKQPEFIGEIFGVPVPMENYYFVKSTLMVFGNKWGKQPQTTQELEDCVWNDLILSYESFRRNIEVSENEVEGELGNTIKAEKVDFDWQKDKEAYAKWLQEKVHEPPELFKNQIKHLIQLQKLRKQVMDSIQPTVTEEEAHQEFLNEYNSLSVELVQFDELKDSEVFYKQAKSNPKFWEDEKTKRPKDFQRPGFVSLEFLMDLWGFDKGAAYEMMKMKIGEIHGPAPIYKGYGVFLVLEQRPADESKYAQQKEYYYEQIRSKKRHEGLNAWIKDLKQQANIRLYKKETRQGSDEKEKLKVNREIK